MSGNSERPHFSSFRSRFAGGERLVGSFIKTPTTHATEIFGPANILSCLDCGAAGVLVPHVATVEKARSVAASARYRGGRRGYSGSPRAGGYRATPIWQVVDEQDASACVIAMIEDPEALDRIDAIVAVDGIHGLFIGRGDLTVALGAKSSAEPEVRSAITHILAAAAKVNKPVCVMVGSAAEAKDFADLGASAFIISSDQSQMRRAAAQTLTEFRKLV